MLSSILNSSRSGSSVLRTWLAESGLLRPPIAASAAASIRRSLGPNSKRWLTARLSPPASSGVDLHEWRIIVCRQRSARHRRAGVPHLGWAVGAASCLHARRRGRRSAVLDRRHRLPRTQRAFGNRNLATARSRRERRRALAAARHSRPVPREAAGETGAFR